MLQKHGDVNGFRHLRYFVAVAETGSLTLAAKSKLHTSQPSHSRQIRDLEPEIGAQLITRTARGVELTPAGQVLITREEFSCRLTRPPKLRDVLFILPSPASRGRCANCRPGRMLVVLSC
jgi:hypothetical protein